MLKNLHCNAGDTGSSSSPGTKIPHAGKKPGPCTETTEPPGPQLGTLCTTRKISRAATKTQPSQSINKCKNSKDDHELLQS